MDRFPPPSIIYALVLHKYIFLKCKSLLETSRYISSFPQHHRIPAGWQKPPHVPPRKTYLGINNKNVYPSKGACGFGKPGVTETGGLRIYVHFANNGTVSSIIDGLTLSEHQRERESLKQTRDATFLEFNL